jgi:hypothetical protein
MAELRTELKGDMAELRGDMAGLKGEMAELRGHMLELRGDMAGMQGQISEVKGTFAARFAEHKGMTQRLFGASIAVNAVAVATAGIL